MRALQRCDFCDEEAAGTFEIMPEELNPTEAERRRTVLCASCKTQLETLIDPLIERVGGNPTQTTNEQSAETASAAETESTADSESDGLIGASDDGSLLGDSESGDESEKQGTDSGQEPTAESTDATQATQAESDDPPENYGKVLRLLRNREFPMTREEIVTIATSAYELKARNVQQIIDESVDRGEFVETDGQLERA
ncbi:hypothetical protein [Halovenus halobia]|uniref:hypothetical protein n=1 Tax=Halovenus halobia TaxID=3396622 RepID=UPI003F568882